MPLGYLALVLHAHLPFVRHPEYDDFLEEDWLYEAITETYIPLLEVFDGLERDGADWRMTMSVTPTLAAMLSDPLPQYRYVRHIDNLIALAAKEVERTRWQPEFNHLARMYHDRFRRTREVFVNQYGNNLPRGFRPYLDAGTLELPTCGATAGFLPRRLRLPGLLPGRGLRPGLRIPPAAAAPERHPQPPRPEVLQDHRPDRPQTPLRAPPGPGQGGGARGQLHVQPRKAGGVAERL